MITRKPHEDAERNEALDRIVAAIDGSALHTFEVRELAAWIAEAGNLAHLVASLEDGHEAAEQRAFDRHQGGRSALAEALAERDALCERLEHEIADSLPSYKIPAPTEAEEQGREARLIGADRVLHCERCDSDYRDDDLCECPDPSTDTRRAVPDWQIEQEMAEEEHERERQDAEDGVDRWADWEPAPEPYEPNPYDGTYSED